MTAAARSAVCIKSVRLYIKRVDRFAEKYGYMLEFHIMPPSALKLNIRRDLLDLCHVLRALLIPNLGVPYLNAVADSDYQRLFSRCAFAQWSAERVILPCLSGMTHLFELLAIRSA